MPDLWPLISGLGLTLPLRMALNLALVFYYSWIFDLARAWRSGCAVCGYTVHSAIFGDSLWMASCVCLRLEAGHGAKSLAYCFFNVQQPGQGLFLQLGNLCAHPS